MKEGKKGCLSARKVLWGKGRKIECLQQETQKGTLNVHDELHSRFHFQITLSHVFLDGILKNQSHNFHPICSLSLREHWQIVIFWPRSQRRVVRGRGADKRLLPFTPAHYWAFRPRSHNPKTPCRRHSWCSCARLSSLATLSLWLTTAAHSLSSTTNVYFKTLIFFSFAITYGIIKTILNKQLPIG